MKKFWKKTEGFTLVELVVVIAILGILAGVGTVGYSGYVKKANLAADDTLLGALNSAFAAACIENGVDSHDLKGAGIEIGDDGAIDVASLAVEHSVLTADACDEAFARYFEGGKFKVTKNLTFIPSAGVFVDLSRATGDLEVSYGGGVIKLNAEDIKAIQNSNFSKVAAAELLNKVNSAAELIRGVGLSEQNLQILQNIAGTDAYLGYLNTLVAKGLNVHELIVQMLGLPAGTSRGDIDDTLYNQTQMALMGNGLVLFTAAETANLSDDDKDDFIALVKSGNGKSTLKTALQSTSDPEAMTKGLVQVTMAYGMATAYAQYKGDPSLASDPISALALLSDTGFQSYVDSDQGKADMDGYMASLRTVSNSTGDVNAVSSVLLNGFNDPELVKVLEAAMGQ